MNFLRLEIPNLKHKHDLERVARANRSPGAKSGVGWRIGASSEERTKGCRPETSFDHRTAVPLPLCLYSYKAGVTSGATIVSALAF